MSALCIACKAMAPIATKAASSRLTLSGILQVRFFGENIFSAWLEPAQATLSFIL